jgi:hypothetical protein
LLYLLAPQHHAEIELPLLAIDFDAHDELLLRLCLAVSVGPDAAMMPEELHEFSSQLVVVAWIGVFQKIERSLMNRYLRQKDLHHLGIPQ